MNVLNSVINLVFKVNSSQPLNTGQTGVSSLLSGPGNWSGRHIIGTQPGRGGFCSIELEDRNKATLQHIYRMSNNTEGAEVSVFNLLIRVEA